MADPITLADLYAQIGTEIQQLLPTTPLFLRSAPLPSIAESEEWLSFELLGMTPSISPQLYVNQQVDLQITCYSLHSQFRKDTNPLRHLEMVDIVKPLIDSRAHDFGNAVIEFFEAKVINLDLRSMGDFSKAIYQQSPKLNTNAAVILNSGQIIATK